MLGTIQLAWVAGFIEGEGCFVFARQTGSVRITVGQVQRWPLEKLHGTFGGSLRLKNSPSMAKLRLNSQPCYIWDLSGIKAAGLMMTLYPFLSPARRDQVGVVLSKWRKRAVAKQFRMACPRGHRDYGRNPTSGTRYCLICARENRRRYKTSVRLLDAPARRIEGGVS